MHIRVGVLGCSDIARRRFIPALLRSKKAGLAAIGSRDIKQAALLLPEISVAIMGYEELVSSPAIDLVYISLVNSLHEEWAVKALNHGKHVLCEKPLALSTRSVDRMLDTANQNGLLLYENIMYLHHPQHDTIKKMLVDGRIGGVTGLKCVFTIPEPAAGNFRLHQEYGGGAFHDLNRYPLSAARHFLRGEIGDIVHCNARWKDNMIMSLETGARTSEGEQFTFSIGFGQPYRSFYEINGTNGMLRLNRAFTPPSDHECQLDACCGGINETIFLPAHDQFRLAIDHVADLIAHGDFSSVYEYSHSLAHEADRFSQRAQVLKGSL